MIALPDEYCREMKRLLGEEYGEYLESFSEAPHAAYRVNTWKVTGGNPSLGEEGWLAALPFRQEEALPTDRDGGSGISARVPWCQKGFYFDGSSFAPAKHPYYYAGLYYIQEPSAMLPAEMLPVDPGELVLDLCAAPGGKATELGSKLAGTGFLVANDISASRAMALAKNLQLAGIANVMVTAETPERLEKAYPETFDKILVDAPCSGEGMFRREPGMIDSWSKRGPEAYAPVQRELLEHAYRMLKPGGMMVYSTCTFSALEDEAVVNWFLERYPDMKICPVKPGGGCVPGRPDLLENPEDSLGGCVRIFPHRAPGEGHFAALLQKGRAEERTRPREIETVSRVRGDSLLRGDSEWERLGGDRERDIKTFLEQILLPTGILTWERDTLCWRSLREPEAAGLRVVYRGLPLCRWKYKVLPSPQLALAFLPGDCDCSLSFSGEDQTLIRYLKGETLQMEGDWRGNVLVCADGFGLGWCQGMRHGMLKNKYHPGWRYQ